MKRRRQSCNGKGDSNRSSRGRTPLLFLGGVTLLGQEMIWGGLLGLALCGLTLRYAYRIWTWQARRLVFFIVF
jgi:hypothetical protein